MTTLTVTAEGQITLQEELLRHLGVGPGQQLVVDKLPEGGLSIRARPKTGHISDIFGIFKDENGPKLTVEEMNEVIADAWAGKREDRRR